MLLNLIITDRNITGIQRDYHVYYVNRHVSIQAPDVWHKLCAGNFSKNYGAIVV